MRNNQLSFGLHSCLLLVLLAAQACTGNECPAKNPTTHSIGINGYNMTVEIAATPFARACGLSLREYLPANHGMLFIDRDDRIHEFWMKNTSIPLEIAYLDSNGQILEIFQMDPGNPERRYRSSVPLRYALETHQGWFASKGITVGDRVDLQLPGDLRIH